MDYEKRLEISYYQTIATINEEHNIYLAQHSKNKRIFVKKLLSVYNLDVYEKLKAHPVKGTPRIIDFIEEDNRLILIEEYIQGKSLSDLINENELTSSDVNNIFIELCKIVNSLHSFNPPVIHRDIKPTNIIIKNSDNSDSIPQVVLLDFNAAKFYSENQSEDTVLIGTHGYAAPEQYGFGASTIVTDIYSIGVVLKQMTESTLSNNTNYEPVISKCMELNPSDRYNSIDELLRDFASKQNLDITEILPSGKHTVNNKLKSLVSKNKLNFLFPGFRSLTLWKMILSSLYYFLVFYIGVGINFKDQPYSLYELIVLKIYIVLTFLSPPFVIFNYLNIQNNLKLCYSKNILLKCLGIILLFIIYNLLLIILMIILSLPTIFQH